MPSSTVCWGIELGAGAIKAIKLEREGDKISVLDFAVIPHKLVFSTPELDIGEATRLALGSLVSQHDLNGASIAVSVPGHSAFARFAKLPPVDPKKIPDIVKFEAVQQIPFPIDDVEWDYQTFTSPDSPEVEVGIFAITRDKVMERLRTWGDVGITPDYINLSPIAAFNAVAYDLAFTDKTPGTVILDVGNTSTDLIVAEAGRLWVRTFPIGGHQFTEALVEAFKLTYSKAEKLKREAETSKHARHVFQAMRPVFGDLAQDVQRSIGYYQSLHRDANLTRLVGLGSTFNLPGLRKYLSQLLQMEVVRLEQFNRISVDGPRAGEFQAGTLNLATVYGLALQGLGLAAIDANLIPRLVVREAMWRRKVKWFGVAAGISVVAGAVGFTRYFLDKAKVAAAPRPAVIEKTKNELRMLQAEWQKVEGAYKPDHAAANATLLLENREIYGHLVNDLGQMMAHARVAGGGSGDKPGDGVVFDEFKTRYDPGGVAEGEETGETPQLVPGRRGGSEDTGFSSGGGGSEPREVGHEPNQGPRRVELTLHIKTGRDDAEEYLQRTLHQWLRQNVTREGIPYKLDSIHWRRTRQEEIPPEVVVAATPGAPQGLPSQWVAPSASNPGGKKPPQFDEYGNQIVEVLTIGADEPAEHRRPDTEAQRVQSQGSAQLDTLAPIPPAPPVGRPGGRITHFVITWDAVLIDKSKEGQS